MKIAEIVKESVEIDSSHVRELRIDMLDSATITKLYRSIIFIYEDKFSFVREFVQNAYDAVVEIWENKYLDEIALDKFLIQNPIVLGLYRDESYELYVEIKETKGAGISKERMLNIFENITKTTKDNSINQIGAKGIGKLSALTYTDEYFIETVYNSVKYNYKVTWYNQSGVPKIIKLSEALSNSENYTSIKVYIKEEDQDSFSDSIVKFLPYFNNIYYVNIPITYTNRNVYSSYSISTAYSSYLKSSKRSNGFNDNILYNYKTFMFRDNVVVFSELHLIVDRIPYKINWKELGMKEVFLPLGIKCSSEFILLNDNRDSIKYTSEVKQYIINKINEFKQELYDLLPKVDFDLYLKCLPIKIGCAEFYPHNNVLYNYKNDDNIFIINLDHLFMYNNIFSKLNITGYIKNNKLFRHSNYLKRAVTENKILYYQDISLNNLKLDFNSLTNNSFVHNSIPRDNSHIHPDKLEEYEKLYLKVVSSKYVPISKYVLGNFKKIQYKQNNEIVGYILEDYSNIKKRTVIKISDIDDKYIVFSSEQDLNSIKKLKSIINDIVKSKKNFLIVAPTYYKKIPYNFKYFSENDRNYIIYCTFKTLRNTNNFDAFLDIFLNIFKHIYNIKYAKIYKIYKDNYISGAFLKYTEVVDEFTSRKLLINNYNNNYIDNNMVIDNDLIVIIEKIVYLYSINRFLNYINYSKIDSQDEYNFIADFINKNLTLIT